MNGHPAMWTGREALDTAPARLLEASAGTGKTWQIAHLLTRLVAETPAVPIERILVITFTNAAAAELRDRVRRRLTHARDALRADVAPDPSGDPLLALLWQSGGDGDERQARLQRIETALASFDLAPISTIHGFSQRMLRELAFASRQEPNLELMADTAPLRDRFVLDALAWGRANVHDLDELKALAASGFSAARLIAIAKAVTTAAAPKIVPDPRDLPCTPGVASGVTAPLVDALIADWPALRAAESAAALLLPGVKKTTLTGLDGWVSAGLPFEERWTGKGEARAWVKAAFGVEGHGNALFERVCALMRAQDEAESLGLATFARDVRDGVEAELLRRGVLSYDAMLSRLAEQIEAGGAGGADSPLAAAIADRFDVALVDEFQDTDAAQWAVLRAVFRRVGHRLLMIGDPKQAIYAFRGADVFVYRRAASGDGAAAPEHATMRVNYRSDPALLAALNRLWGGAREVFGPLGFDFVEVSAPDDRAAGELMLRGEVASDDGPRPRRAVELRWISKLAERRPAAGGDGAGNNGDDKSDDGDEDPDDDPTRTPIGNKETAKELCGQLCGDEVLALLDGQHRLGDAGQTVRPSDIAVLVRTHRQGETIVKALRTRGIPVVAGGRGKVHESVAANWLLALLDALATDGGDGAARAVALTPLFGLSPAQLQAALLCDEAALVAAEQHTPAQKNVTTGENVAAGENVATGENAAAVRAWSELRAALQRLAELYERDGFFRAWDALADGERVIRRVLGHEDGERLATDLRHLAEQLHRQERQTRASPSALAAWLRQRIADAAGEDEDALRLESDALAVRVVTVHKAKGLEYPIVLMPFGWDQGSPMGETLYHDDSDALCLNLYPARTEAGQAAETKASEEAQQEAIRLVYVAMTRAAHHLVVWHGPAGRGGGRDVYAGALGQVLLGGVAGAADDALAAFASLDDAASSIGVRVEGPPRRAIARWRNAGVDELPTLQPTALFGRERLSDGWHIASYTSVVRGKTGPHDDRVLRAEADAEPSVDEELPGRSAGEGQAALATVDDDESEPPLANFVRGREVGVWVHAVLEELDFAAGEDGVLRGHDGRDVATLIQALGARHGVRSASAHRELEQALPAILATPLGSADTPWPEAFCLGQLQTNDRLDELAFDIGLGDQGRRVRPERVAAAMALMREERPDWDGLPWLNAWLGAAAQNHPDVDDGADGVTDVEADVGADAHADADGPSVFPRLWGVLTGFVDLVLRVPGPDGELRYVVCDYKTNRLIRGGDRSRSPRSCYSRAGLVDAMAEHHYHLQALLYTVALHRLLRQRLGAHYDYDRHVGGHLYLFVRCMEGAESPRIDGMARGVYADRWPRRVVEALDAALDDRDPATAQGGQG